MEDHSIDLSIAILAAVAGIALATMPKLLNPLLPIGRTISKYHRGIGLIWLIGIAIAFVSNALSIYHSPFPHGESFGVTLMLFIVPPVLALGTALLSNTSLLTRVAVFLALANVTAFFLKPFWSPGRGDDWLFIFEYGAMWFWSLVVLVVSFVTRTKEETGDNPENP